MSMEEPLRKWRVFCVGLWTDTSRHSFSPSKASCLIRAASSCGSYRIYGSSKGSILSKPPLPFRERIRGEGDRRTDWHHALRRMCRASLASAPQYFLCWLLAMAHISCTVQAPSPSPQPSPWKGEGVMIQKQFEHLFGEIQTRSIGDKFNAERHCISSGWNHEFSMIPFFPQIIWPKCSEGINLKSKNFFKQTSP